MVQCTMVQCTMVQCTMVHCTMTHDHMTPVKKLPWSTILNIPWYFGAVHLPWYSVPWYSVPWYSGTVYHGTVYHGTLYHGTLYHGKCTAPKYHGIFTMVYHGMELTILRDRLVGICVSILMQDYRFVHVAVMICATVDNKQRQFSTSYML